jgi:hypothetical protein
MDPDVPTVAAVAGRRVDAPDSAAPRFPAQAVPRVAEAVKKLLAEHHVVAVVASAACGADIVALEAASDLGIRTRIVLPFDAERFLRTSVADRGEEWGDRYRAVLQRATARGDVVVIEEGPGTDDQAYARATERILSETQALARSNGARAIALAIWDEKPRSGTDATRDFIDSARRQEMATFSIATDAAR